MHTFVYHLFIRSFIEEAAAAVASFPIHIDQLKKFLVESMRKLLLFFLQQTVPNIIAIVRKVKISFFKKERDLLFVRSKMKMNRANPKYLDAFENNICGWLCDVPK